MKPSAHRSSDGRAVTTGNQPPRRDVTASSAKPNGKSALNHAQKSVEVPALTQKPRHQRWKSPESRERQLAGIRAHQIKPGHTLNPGGRPKRKPFHDAAMELADTLIGTDKSSQLMVQPTDTVATAVMKSLAASALSFGPQKVSAAKELADRAEGPPAQIVINNDEDDVKIQRGTAELLVRFGIQFSAIVPDSTDGA